MSGFEEKFNAGKALSAEKSMTLDVSDKEMAGGILNHDPVAFLRTVRDDFLKKRDAVAADLEDALANPILEALVGLDEATEYLKDNQISINDPNLIEYIQEKSDREKHNSSVEGEVLFTMLKEAGYTREEVETWVDLESYLVPTQVTEERRVTLNGVYGEK